MDVTVKVNVVSGNEILIACLRRKIELPPEVVASMRFFDIDPDCISFGVAQHGYNLRTNEYEVILDDHYTRDQEDAKRWINYWQKLGFEISWQEAVSSATGPESDKAAVAATASSAESVTAPTNLGGKWVTFDWERGREQSLPTPKKWILLAAISTHGDISVCVGFMRDTWKTDSVAFYSPSLHADSGVIFAWADILPETFEFPAMPWFNVFSTAVRQRIQKLGFCPDAVSVDLIRRHEKLNFTVEESARAALATI